MLTKHSCADVRRQVISSYVVTHVIQYILLIGFMIKTVGSFKRINCVLYILYKC